MGLSFFNGGGFVGGGQEIDYRSIADGGGRSSPTAFSDDLKDILFRTRLLPVLHQHNHQFAVVGYFDGDIFAAVRLQDAARPQFLPFSAVKQKYRAAFGLGNQQGVAGVVVAGDFLAFGQGFTDDGVVDAFKDFARALGDFGGRHGGGKKADEDGEKLGFDVFHDGFPLVADKIYGGLKSQ